MCILSWVRKPGNAWVLTHNRDENIERPASPNLITKTVNGEKWKYPEDLQSGGTWILLTETYVSCILNGAFERHKRKLPYHRSRGVLGFEVADYASISDYLNQVNLDNVEPFTQVLIDRKSGQVWTMVWDETEKHINQFEENLLVLSSSTLYPEEKKKFNQQYLTQMEEKTSAHLLEAHKSLQMNLGDVHHKIKTTSISQLRLDKNHITFNYYPIKNGVLNLSQH